MGTENVVLLVAGILVITLIPLAAALFGVKRLQTRRTNAMLARFPEALRVEPANFYGQESSGKAQLRGNGVLALLPDRILFERLLPRREYAIPLDRITGVETPTRFLGKTNFRPLLKVIYQNEGGQTDSMAWLVSDPPGWQARLGKGS